jgi:hypothetical protein
MEVTEEFDSEYGLRSERILSLFSPHNQILINLQHRLGKPLGISLQLRIP